MAWTTPMTAVAGSIYTASQFNTYTRDNLLHLRANPVNRCIAFHSTTQSVNGTTTLNLNSEDLDTATMHDLSTNNNRITIPSGGDGYYMAWGQSLVSNAGNACELFLRKGGNAIRAHRSQADDGPVLVVCALSILMTAGEYFDLGGNTSGALNYGSATATYATRLEVVGPLPPS